MGKTTHRKLKVFQAQIGFHDTVVTASSQAAALRAWGVHQNLFASGQARVATDPATVALAIARPEVPLRRAIGSDEAFSLELGRLPTIPDRPTQPKPQAKPISRKQPAADRSRLTQAEADLRNLEERRKSEEADFRQQQKALESRREDAQAGYVKDRKRVKDRLECARRAYRKAGSRD